MTEQQKIDRLAVEFMGWTKIKPGLYWDAINPLQGRYHQNWDPYSSLDDAHLLLGKALLMATAKQITEAVLMVAGRGEKSV